MNLLTDKEIGILEYRIKNNNSIKDEAGRLFDDYKFCVAEIEKVLPVLKKYAVPKCSYPI